MPRTENSDFLVPGFSRTMLYLRIVLSLRYSVFKVLFAVSAHFLTPQVSGFAVAKTFLHTREVNPHAQRCLCEIPMIERDLEGIVSVAQAGLHAAPCDKTSIGKRDVYKSGFHLFCTNFCLGLRFNLFPDSRLRRASAGRQG